MKQEKAYNPLDKRNLGKSVADALLECPVHRLPPSEPFPGPGIYVIYYTGDYPAYRQIAERNWDDQFELPIYVGKAVPLGARKGGQGFDNPLGISLFRRLEKHAASIKSTINLHLEDFHCRYLVVDDIWIPLGESLLIEKFSPLWNRVIDGFGNNDPGKGRYQQMRSAWDTLHPGRPWATKCSEYHKSEAQLLELVSRRLT
jgi:Eco29kI restriction endonuclease